MSAAMTEREVILRDTLAAIDHAYTLPMASYLLQADYGKYDVPQEKVLNEPWLPDEYVIVTSSYRKIILLAVQLLILNDQPVPEVFEKAINENRPLDILELLKRNFFNGNGASQETFFIGMYQGRPVYTMPNHGEKNDGSAQIAEARNKAQWWAEKAVPDESRKKTLYIGLDTMDEVIFPGEVSASLMKPATLSQRLMAGEANEFTELGGVVDENVRTVIENGLSDLEWYIDFFYRQATEVKGVTAINISDNENNSLVGKEVVLKTKIDPEKVNTIAGNADKYASGGGLFQYLINFEYPAVLAVFENPERVKAILDTIPEEKRGIAGFLALCQILGVPMWEIGAAIQDAIAEKNRRITLGQVPDAEVISEGT
jgi:hypothetical protein